MSVLAALSWPTVERLPIVGSFAISPHGITIALGFLLGTVIMRRRLTAAPDVQAQLDGLFVRVAVGGIVGARGFYVLSRADVYLDAPLSAFSVWEGGLTLLGGIAGAVAAGTLYARRRHLPVAMLLDAAAPGLAAGLAVGRVGDLMIGEHLGRVAENFPLAWRCTGSYWDPTTNRLGPLTPPEPIAGLNGSIAGCFDAPVHQMALYDLLAGAVLLVVLLALGRRQRFPGALAVAFGMGYASFRMVMDLARQGRRFQGMTGSQYAAALTLLALTTYLLWRKPWRTSVTEPPVRDHQGALP